MFWCILKEKLDVRGFTVSNGVRQGGILSPLLFNFYMNELSKLLNKMPAGCACAGQIIKSVNVR